MKYRNFRFGVKVLISILVYSIILFVIIIVWYEKWLYRVLVRGFISKYLNIKIFNLIIKVYLYVIEYVSF